MGQMGDASLWLGCAEVNQVCRLRKRAPIKTRRGTPLCVPRADMRPRADTGVRPYGVVGRSRGRQKLNVLPLPSSLSNQRRPWWWPMISWQIVRPTPRPPKL